nr:BZIP domain-containing protein [Zostera marina]
MELAITEYDFESFFESISVDFDFDTDFPLPEIAEDIAFPSNMDQPSAMTNDPTNSSPLWVKDLENFLMTGDEDGEGETEVIHPDLLPYASSEDLSEKRSEGEVTGKGMDLEVRSEEGTEGGDLSGIKGDVDEERSGDEDISKKRLRQIKNRDSAMKSRERKRKYVKDLEAKAKILESECRRLEHLYQCVKAENISLHRHLQKDSVSVVYQAGQETAVLFKESLLLGSLFWLVSIAYLFLGSNLLAWNLLDGAGKKGRSDPRKKQDQETVLTRGIRSEILLTPPVLNSKSVFMRRRYKALKPKFKKIILISCS